MILIWIIYFSYLWHFVWLDPALFRISAARTRFYLTRVALPAQSRANDRFTWRVLSTPTQSPTYFYCRRTYLTDYNIIWSVFCVCVTHLAAVAADTAVPVHGVPPQWAPAVWSESTAVARSLPSRGTNLCTSSGRRWCSCPCGSPSWSMSSSGCSCAWFWGWPAGGLAFWKARERDIMG